MLLLQLLLFRLISTLFRLLLVFLLLLLLELLSFLILLRDQFVLLLLILLVLLRIAGVGCSWPFHRRQVVRMDGVAGLCNISGATWRSVRSPSLSRRHNVAVEFSRPRGRRDRRLAHVHRSAHLRVTARRLYMLCLRRNRSDVPLTRRRLFFRPWTHVDATIAPVEADMVHRLVDYSRVVNVVNHLDVHVEHGTVVEKVSAVPTPAFKSQTKIAKAVIDPAVETDVRTPVAVIENKPVAAPTPIPRRPQKTNFRRHHPGSRHPVIIVDVVVVGPVAGCPKITIARTDRLFINRQRGWPDRNQDAHAGVRRSYRHRQHK